MIISKTDAGITSKFEECLKVSVGSLKDATPPKEITENRTLLADPKLKKCIIQNPQHKNVAPLIKRVNNLLRSVKDVTDSAKTLKTTSLKNLHEAGGETVGAGRKYLGVHFVLEETGGDNSKLIGKERTEWLTGVMAKINIKGVTLPPFMQEYMITMVAQAQKAEKMAQAMVDRIAEPASAASSPAPEAETPKAERKRASTGQGFS